MILAGNTPPSGESSHGGPLRCVQVHGRCPGRVGQAGGAKGKYFAARALREHLFGSGHLCVAEVDVCLGAVYTRTAMFSEAAAAFGEALRGLEEAEERVGRRDDAAAAALNGAPPCEPPLTGDPVQDWGREDTEGVIYRTCSCTSSRAGGRMCDYRLRLLARKAMAACTALAKQRGGEFHEALEPLQSRHSEDSRHVGDTDEALTRRGGCADGRQFGPAHPTLALLLRHAELSLEHSARFDQQQQQQRRSPH